MKHRVGPSAAHTVCTQGAVIGGIAPCNTPCWTGSACWLQDQSVLSRTSMQGQPGRLLYAVHTLCWPPVLYAVVSTADLSCTMVWHWHCTQHEVAVYTAHTLDMLDQPCALAPAHEQPEACSSLQGWSGRVLHTARALDLLALHVAQGVSPEPVCRQA